MNIDIFIIIYLIIGGLLSILVSFLFFRQYVCKEKDKIKNYSKIYYSAYFFNIFFFALNIFHIFIASLDFSLSTFEDIPGFESDIGKKLFEYLPDYYLYIDWITKGLSLISEFYYLLYTSGYFYKCDIICDIITRSLHFEKETCQKVYKFLKWIIIGSIVLIILILLNIKFNIVTIEVLKSGYNFFLFLSNYSNFLHTILLLFYIGFVVQNLFQLQLIEQNEDQKENYNIWKLGKIYHYYKEEREEIDEDLKVIKNKYKSIFPDEESKTFLMNNKDFKNFEKKYQNFKEEIQETYKNYRYIDIKFTNLKEAVDKFREQIYQNEKNKNDDQGNIKKLYLLNDQRENNKNYEYELLSRYKEKIDKQKKRCNCLFLCCCCCCCCCCCNKDPNKKVINDICYMMSKVKEKLISFKRKCNLIESIKDSLIQCSQKNKCCKCNKYLLLAIITMAFLILLEFPLPLLSWEKSNMDKEEYEFAFIFLLILYVVLISFYFIIFAYALYENEYIHGQGLYGKNKSVSDPINFFSFTESLDFFSSVIYHAGWVLNKNGNIKAKFNEVFYLPDYEINEDLNLLNIFPYISLGLILIFIFISSNFSKISLCGFILFDINENAGFFSDNEKFYGYFFIGCGCYIDIFKGNNQTIDLFQEDEDEEESDNTNLPDNEMELLVN